MIRIRWGRVIVAALAAEVIVILLLLVVSSVLGTSAERAGYYVAPPASGLASFLMALWVARRVKSRAILHGFLVGLTGVALTSGFVFTAKPGDQWMYGVSFVLRIVGGYLGGLAAQKAVEQEVQLQ